MRFRYVPGTRAGKRRTSETAMLVTFMAALVLPGVPVVLRDTYPRAWCAARLPACPERQRHRAD